MIPVLRTRSTPYREVTMPGLPSASTAQHLPPPWRADLPQLTTIVRCLIGHTVAEVERELILCSLSHYCGVELAPLKFSEFQSELCATRSTNTRHKE